MLVIAALGLCQRQVLVEPSRLQHIEKLCFSVAVPQVLGAIARCAALPACHFRMQINKYLNNPWNAFHHSAHANANGVDASAAVAFKMLSQSLRQAARRQRGVVIEVLLAL